MCLGGRYSVMPNGELHVHRIENDDNDDDDDSDDNVHIIDNNKNDRHHHHHKQQQKQRNQNSHEQPRKLMFRCQTKHMLSGNTKLSANYGRLIVTGMIFSVYSILKFVNSFSKNLRQTCLQKLSLRHQLYLPIVVVKDQ